ncbi:hypothetical protein Vadar_023843 [Vaccinium darrowii]|uniref:Uncharacterized protein n=1 Tax=Vaccinium darrowii TaxID=229202 RepID=A0ACB7YNX6_9ERIC|nr:hypothetical protein Vadar_023843 [Vaccinium darrowii]
MLAGLGEVEEVVMAQLSGNQGRCIHVKVELDITKPLPRAKKIYTADWKPILVPFRYEKLPLLCYYYGVVGHDDRACMMKYNDTKAGCVKENQYGGWLRASPVKIPGRKRPEGRLDSSPAESSADRNSFGNAGDYGKDVHVPTKSGEVKKGRRQLQWESVTKDGENRVVGLGQTILSATEKELVEPNNFSHARSEPINPISVSQVEKEDASKTVHVSSTGQNKKAPIKGYKRIPKEIAISELDRQRVTGEGQAKSAKRKCDEVCENGELMQGTIVDPIGIAGGLAVLWKRDLAVRFIRSSSFFIEMKIKDDDSNHVWRLINLYASSTDSVRKSQWEELIGYRKQCSEDWYDRAKVQNLFAVGSDHAALLVDANPPKFSGPRQFRFDKRWVDDPDCYDVICKGWQGTIRGSNMFKVFSKVRNTRRELRVWSKKRNFNARRRINEVQGKLKEIGKEREHGEMGQIRALEKELGEAWVQEERFWRQKARISWMVEGDRNTSFFHAKVTQRRKRNAIAGIQNSDGSWCDDPEDITKEFVQYFHQLF